MELHVLGVGVLTWLTFLPVIGMVAVLLLPKNNAAAVKWTAAVATFLQLVLAAMVFMMFNKSMVGINDAASMQFVEKFKWIDIQSQSWFGRIQIEYFMGIDGLSGPMVLLTALISFIAVFASWNIEKALKGYMAMLLLLDTGMMGVFVSLDFFLFYVFWEVMLLPMYFLIGIWGGPRREYAAIKFFLYTLLGSVLMLLAMIALYFSVAITDPATGEKIHTFNMLAMMNPANFEPGSLLYGFGTYWRYLAYIALFIGFAIKVPIFPFHTWLPDAHVEAPTAISVILAGVLLKMGTYGLLRVSYPMFPEIATATTWYLAILAFINIVYGALCAMAQKDFKKLIAYSSISHMGIVLLGMAALNTQGMLGAVFQMFNHGTITAMLFLIVGVIYDRAHTRDLDAFGGLALTMPRYTGIMTVAFFAALGLPGLSGFISEAFAFLGAFQVEKIRIITIASTLGIVLTAAYMLWTLQRVFLGQPNEKWAKLPDINPIETFTLVPLAVIVLVLGIYPSFMLDMMTTSLNHLVDVVAKGGAAVAMIP
ncbi:MAG: NADH-quinone oxidoreductase subunit M [Ignavibacteriales bacterium]|nr:NADH-quinone oxidoreductase subunit M [Ignavibacteriales bacterium]